MLDGLNIKEYWKLKFKNKNIDNKILQLKDQFDKAQDDIKLYPQI